MQPFLLLKQTLEQESSFGPLSLEGAHVHFNRFDQLFWKSGSEVAESIRVGYGCRNEEGFRRCTDVFEITANELVVSEMSIARDGHEWTLKRQQLQTLGELSSDQRLHRASETLLEPVLWKEEMARARELQEHRIVNRIAHGNLTYVWFSGSTAFVSPLLLWPLGDSRRLQSAPFCWPFDVLEQWVRQLIHVPGDRGTMSRYHRWSPGGSGASFGVFQDHYASVLWDWNRRKSDATNLLERWMSMMGLGNQVQTHKVNDVDVEVLVSRKAQQSNSPEGNEDMVSIADTGLGVSYALPWLVALAAADDQPVYIEEPEAHLHPEAQYKAAEVLAAAAHRGTTVIVETHSDILLVGIQRLIARGELDPKDVSLNWFSRDMAGATSVNRAELTASGEFGDWPGDLDSTLMRAQGAFLDASIDREVREGNDA